MERALVLVALMVACVLARQAERTDSQRRAERDAARVEKFTDNFWKTLLLGDMSSSHTLMGKALPDKARNSLQRLIEQENARRDDEKMFLYSEWADIKRHLIREGYDPGVLFDAVKPPQPVEMRSAPTRNGRLD